MNEKKRKIKYLYWLIPIFCFTIIFAGCLFYSPPPLQLAFMISIDIAIDNGGEAWFIFPRPAFEGNEKFFKAKDMTLRNEKAKNWTVEDAEDNMLKVSGSTPDWGQYLMTFESIKSMGKDPHVDDEESVKRNLFHPAYNFTKLNETECEQGSKYTTEITHTYTTKITFWSIHNISYLRIRIGSAARVPEGGSISNHFHQYGLCIYNTTKIEGGIEHTIDLPIIFTFYK
ncbi:MAG: hypothetical protein QXT63_00975 [Thermoplasmata archaeon]